MRPTHWRSDFYKAELPQSQWLEHYASLFDTAEINNSFYRLPDASTFARIESALAPERTGQLTALHGM